MNNGPDQEWIKNQRDYLERQAPLRAAWNDENLSQEERDAAGDALRQLVAETTEKCPPLTGTLRLSSQRGMDGWYYLGE